MWTGTTGGPVDSSPAVANGVVYVGSGDGKLYAYSLGGVSGPMRPFPSSLSPNYSLKVSA
ncbi:MAG TPA: PQQ-binding-like beta-propeller repeat protein [Candidatus Dormibacteraeota bacterium]